MRRENNQALRWEGGVTRQRNQVEVVRGRERQGSQTEWKEGGGRGRQIFQRAGTGIEG